MAIRQNILDVYVKKGAKKKIVIQEEWKQTLTKTRRQCGQDYASKRTVQGRHLGDIVDTASDASREFASNDHLIVFGGTNDIEHGKPDFREQLNRLKNIKNCKKKTYSYGDMNQRQPSYQNQQYYRNEYDYRGINSNNQDMRGGYQHGYHQAHSQRPPHSPYYPHQQDHRSPSKTYHGSDPRKVHGTPQGFNRKHINNGPSGSVYRQHHTPTKSPGYNGNKGLRKHTDQPKPSPSRPDVSLKSVDPKDQEKKEESENSKHDSFAPEYTEPIKDLICPSSDSEAKLDSCTTARDYTHSMTDIVVEVKTEQIELQTPCMIEETKDENDIGTEQANSEVVYECPPPNEIDCTEIVDNRTSFENLNLHASYEQPENVEPYPCSTENQSVDSHLHGSYEQPENVEPYPCSTENQSVDSHDDVDPVVEKNSSNGVTEPAVEITAADHEVLGDSKPSILGMATDSSDEKGIAESDKPDIQFEPECSITPVELKDSLESCLEKEESCNASEVTSSSQLQTISEPSNSLNQDVNDELENLSFINCSENKASHFPEDPNLPKIVESIISTVILGMEEKCNNAENIPENIQGDKSPVHQAVKPSAKQEIEKTPMKNTIDAELTGKLNDMYITPARSSRKSRALVDSTNIVESSSIAYVTREVKHKEAPSEVIITPVRRSTRKKTTTPGPQELSQEKMRAAKVVPNPFLNA